MAAYGAAYRGKVVGYSAGDAGARQFLADLFTNVSVMDASGLDSYETFARGVGDAAITYENQYFAGAALGDALTIVYPSSTILIENPVALVDAYVDEHGSREVAQAFIDFLYRPEIQQIFAADGFRPPVAKPTEAAATETPAAFWLENSIDTTRFPIPADLFTIDDFGGWSQVKTDIFGDDGVYTQVIAQVKGG